MELILSYSQAVHSTKLLVVTARRRAVSVWVCFGASVFSGGGLCGCGVQRGRIIMQKIDVVDRISDKKFSNATCCSDKKIRK